MGEINEMQRVAEKITDGQGTTENIKEKYVVEDVNV